MHGERRESMYSVLFEFYSDRRESESLSVGVFPAKMSHRVSGDAGVRSRTIDVRSQRDSTSRPQRSSSLTADRARRLVLSKRSRICARRARHCPVKSKHSEVNVGLHIPL